MSGWHEFSGLNRGYVLELYEKFRRDPTSVDPATRSAFEAWAPASEASSDVDHPDRLSLCKVVGVANLAESIRRYGHLAARLDPLGTTPQGDPALLPETHGLTEQDLKSLPALLVDGPAAENAGNAFDAIQRLRAIYGSTTGFDFVTAFPPAATVPEVSNVNATAAGQTRAALATTRLAPGGAAGYFTFGGSQLIVDVFGTFSG